MASYGLNIYSLPTIDFVGGSTQKLSFNVYLKSKSNPVDLAGCSANFAMISYNDKFGSPAISKSMSVRSAGVGSASVVTVELTPQDTAALMGKYIYQITVRTPEGEVSIPNQGLLYVIRNIDQGHPGS